MRQSGSPGSPLSRLPLAFRSLNFVPEAFPTHTYVAYAVDVRRTANSAASITAIRRDDRIIEPSLLPVGRTPRFPPERGGQYVGRCRIASIGHLPSGRSVPKLRLMDLEEHSLESVSERCDECGAQLTQ